MKRTIRHLMGTVLLALCLLTSATGCGSTRPTTFYLMSPIADAPIPVETSRGKKCITLGIGPIHLPEYLDRPQMLTQAGANKLQLAEFDHWAEPLEKTFSRVLDENLGKLVCVEEAAHYPWQGSVEVDYQVTLSVIRFHGMADGNVILLAQWSVLEGGSGEKAVAKKRTTISQPIQGQGYDALAAAQSRAIEALSREIAAALAGHFLPAE